VLFLTALPCLLQRFCVRQEPAVCTDWFVDLLDYSVTPYRLHLTQLTFLTTWQCLVLGLKRLQELV
jgi:hypothetical protein